MGPFVQLAARLFRDRYVPDLLIRHTQAMDSGQARKKQVSPTFLNQTNTMMLNSAHRDRAEGKSIVLVDDFITRGYSCKCARNLLLLAGAAKVTCVALGKYGPSMTVVTRPKGYKWDPYTAKTHTSGTFIEYSQMGTTDANALTIVRDSYQRVAQTKV
jgi:adenine/guanine phosphoribosyltransferase-like PRPP-binding protein